MAGATASATSVGYLRMSNLATAGSGLGEENLGSGPWDSNFGGGLSAQRRRLVRAIAVAHRHTRVLLGPASGFRRLM